ncbi:hypothetical protein PIB30_026704 [Stylosanthes scabra]|uniref:Uncharacterized protein n=1 Tax=Stylosanthes scabra TaxID=79078 RepID=A0ABU6SAJ6_9FABA|nr:hypothetical protein [Stylosanthes scabra]
MGTGRVRCPGLESFYSHCRRVPLAQKLRRLAGLPRGEGAGCPIIVNRLLPSAVLASRGGDDDGARRLAGDGAVVVALMVSCSSPCSRQSSSVTRALDELRQVKNNHGEAVGGSDGVLVGSVSGYGDSDEDHWWSKRVSVPARRGGLKDEPDEKIIEFCSVVTVNGMLVLP